MKSKRQGEHSRPRVSLSVPSPKMSRPRRSTRSDSPARRGQKQPGRRRSPKIFYSSRICFSSKPHVTQREAKRLAEWGIVLRPGIERDTLLTPLWIAESVLGEASRFLKVDLPDEWAEWLDQRAERCYASHAQFRQLVRRKDAGRNYLDAFLRHWLAGKLQKERLSLYQRLPRTYMLGEPLKR